MEVLQHECGVAMVHCHNRQTNAVPMTMQLIEHQRHRGRQGAGIALGNLSVTKFAGDNAVNHLVNAVVAPSNVAMSHVRYATNGDNGLNAVHPFVSTDNQLALCGNFHFGNDNSNNDGKTVTEDIANALVDNNIERALTHVLINKPGGFVLAGITLHGQSFAIRDRYGIRPAYYISTDSLTAVASERFALTAVFPNAVVKELMPGHAIITSPNGSTVVTRVLPPAKPAECPFEIIYFSSGNDPEIAAKRQLLGRSLAKQIRPLIAGQEQKPILTYVPNTAVDAWKGLSKELGDSVISVDIIKKSTFKRTFINTTELRENEVQDVYKLSSEAHKYTGRTIIIIDDSIVRGTTFRNGNLLAQLSQLNPQQIIIASAAPPVLYPDYYGIDIPTQAELVAYKALTAKGDIDMSRMAKLLTPLNMTIPLTVVYQTVADLKHILGHQYGTWVFTGEYPDNP